VDKTWHPEGAKFWQDHTGPHRKFCSAEDYLVVCNYNDGSFKSSIVCFSTSSAPEPLWVKKMMDTADAGERHFTGAMESK